MSSRVGKIELVLGSEKFQVQAPPERHHELLEVADAVNARIGSIQQEGWALSVHRAALMAAFQFAYELEEVSKRSGMSEEECQKVSSRIDRLISQIEEEIQATE